MEYKCNYCKNNKVVYDEIRHEIYCSECGLVLSAPPTDNTTVYQYGYMVG